MRRARLRDMLQKLPVTAFLLPLLVHSLPIDNGVVGRPWVSCENEMVILKARTEKPFVGRVFVKGMSTNDECAHKYSEPSDVNIELQIKMGTCQMRRQRYTEPPGMQQSVIVIVSFHPVFLTKVDMAYNIRCLYMTRPVTLTQSIEVSMLTPTDLYNEIMQTPKCDYTIRLGSKDGPLARYAVVGQKLFHVWRCDASPTDGILVKNCAIRDNSNSVYRALDDLGCPADQHVVGYLTYNAELNEAFVEVHAFKFADEPYLYFQCEITMCAKNAAESYQKTSDLKPCLGISPPSCGTTNYNVAGPPAESRMPSISPPLCGACPVYSSMVQQPVNAYPTARRRKPRWSRSLPADGVVKLRLTYPTTSGRSTIETSSVGRSSRAVTEQAITDDSDRTMDVVPQNDYLIVLDMIGSDGEDAADTTVADIGQLFQSHPECEVGWKQRVVLIVSCSTAMTMTLLSGLLTTFLCQLSSRHSRQGRKAAL